MIRNKAECAHMAHVRYESLLVDTPLKFFGGLLLANL